jgi:HAD superfamily hydrolase (TIGR01509 family)
MDGVIVDSNPVHTRAWETYNRRFGIEVEGMAERMFGRRNDEIVRDFFGAGLSVVEVDAHGAAKERLYRELMRPLLPDALVPGVRQFLERHAGTPMGVASNAEPANVAFVLDAAGLRGFFRVVVDGHMVTRPKPDPEIYVLTAELLGSPPRDCIVFEDSEAGVSAARAAGMRVVGVRSTHRDLAGVDLAIDNFLSGDLEPWLASQQPAA